MSETRLEIRQSQHLSQSLQTALRLLTMDLDGLSEYLARQVQENPALEYVPPARSPQDYARIVRTRWRGGEGRQEDPAAPVTAYEDLEEQLRLSDLPAGTRRLAVRMLHQLTPRGYFTQDLDEFALETGVPHGQAREALEAIQALEPAGIGARSVEECLSLQLARMDGVDPLCYELIRGYLLEIGKGNYRKIARETGATAVHAQKCVELIRTLSPAPCSLREETVQYIMPEFSVEADADGRLTLVFHNDYYPTFRTDENFRRLSETLTGEEQAFARKLLASSSQLVRAVELRQTTMEKVARVILREQRAFFLGQYSLLPLRCDDVARELEVHESTVYRAIQGKYLYCARGTYPLSHFFQREYAGGTSSARVKELIRELCAGDGHLSDREITEALEKRGIKLSRRTVAKYRSQLNIASSFVRGS